MPRLMPIEGDAVRYAGEVGKVHGVYSFRDGSSVDVWFDVKKEREWSREFFPLHALLWDAENNQWIAREEKKIADNG